jgi:argininosuccinate lyase
VANSTTNGSIPLSSKYAYASTNLSPLGACALAGTSWAISRKKTAKLLGFNGVLENTLDSVASRDFMAEAASAMTILLSNLSRMAIDLEIWSSFEFGLIKLDERYCSTSSIMPQKKNPTVLEHIRAHAASAIGYLVQIMAALKGTAYTHTRDLNECHNAFRLLAADTLTSIDAMKGVISTMTPNRDLMAKRAMTGFSTMTELADLLVRERSLSFRTAHEIVANLTNDLIAQEKLVTETTTEMLDKSSLKVIGKKMALDGNVIRSAFDPLTSIKTKKAGGPSPREVRRMIDDRRSRIQHRTLELKIKTDSLAAAYNKLEDTEQTIHADATLD